MTDKVQKIREEIERLQNELIQEKEKGFGSDTDDACILELQNVLTYIDSLQEEPCNSCQGFNDKDKCDELVFTHNCPIVKNPVSIWHDASEIPDKEKKILTIGYNDETYVSYFNGVNPRLIKQWAYIDVLLNLTTKEEPVSETNKVMQVRICLEEVATTINPFIDEVIEQFNLKDKSIIAKEIQYRGVGLKGDFGENIHRSDDEVIYILKEDKTVGLIVIRRTEFNNAEITMVKTEERFKEKSND